MKIELYEQYQHYNNFKYNVSDLIEHAKDIKAESFDIAQMSKYYSLTELPEPYYDLQDFVNAVKSVEKADLKYPILLYRGFVMDGKHRLAKAMITNKKKIKVKVLDTLPEPVSKV